MKTPTPVPQPPPSPFLHTFRSLPPTKDTEMQQAIRDIGAAQGVIDAAFVFVHSDSLSLSQ